MRSDPPMSLAERLRAATGSDGVVDLAAVGTPQEIANEAASLAASPDAAFAARAFVRARDSFAQAEDWLGALRRLCDGLAAQRSYLALREATDALLSSDVVDIVGPMLHDALQLDVELIREYPLVAGLRLNIMLEVVAVTGHAPYRVLELLTQPIDGFPVEYDDQLARAIGVAGDLWKTEAEQERFAAALDALVARGSDDAAYERALLRLRQALESQDEQEMLSGISQACERFEALVSQIEDRSDARGLASACRAVLAFQDGNHQALRDAAGSARETASHRALMLQGLHGRDAVTAGHASELAWVSLAWHLECAATHLSDDTFMDTWAAVESMTKVYEADRQVTNLNVIRVLIQPRIVNDLAVRNAMSRQLQRAVEFDRAREEPILAAEIYQLVDLVEQVRATPREPADDPKEGSLGQPYLHGLLGSAASLVNQLPVADRVALESAAHQTFAGAFAGDRPTSDLVTRLTASLMTELSANPAFAGLVKSNFSLVLLNTVRFLAYVGDNKQPYTAPITADHPAPKEDAIQTHFAQFLSATELAARVGSEHSHIAHGRADVVVTFDGAQRYVTEVKRELVNAGRESIESAYLAQTLEYQSTNEPFGQLLVLDLCDHSAGTPHISESIWVVHRRDASQVITASVVVAVVRGNRPSPSAMG